MATMFEPRPFGPIRIPMREKATSFSYIGTRCLTDTKVGEDSALTSSDNSGYKPELPLQTIAQLQDPVIFVIMVLSSVKGRILEHLIVTHGRTIQIHRPCSWLWRPR